MFTGDGGGPVGRAVVDDEDVRLRKTRVQLVENRRQVLLLVPRRDEDEGVAHHDIVGARLAPPSYDVVFGLDAWSTSRSE